MRRDLRSLADTPFDLVVIGGGLFGACAAWDAAQRGLSVALVEQGDFSAGTSAHSYKVVHGGIRYLQHADLFRVRQSSNERRAFLRIAPHLVHPLPIVIPTYGRGRSGKTVLRAGLHLYDLVTIDRNAGIGDTARRVPRARILGRDETRRLFPNLVRSDATGAGVFADGQFQNPPRLVWAVVESAVSNGAVAANYLEATDFIRRGDSVTGVTVHDHSGGEQFDIQAKVVLNAAGSYAEALLARNGLTLRPAGTYSRDACFVVPRRLLPGDHALALMTATRDPDAKLSRGARHLFIAPWREYTLVGTWHRVQRPGSLDIQVGNEELSRFVADANAACPELKLTLEDVSVRNSGLVPFGENEEGAEDLRYGHRSQLIDHAKVHGCENLITLIGVRLTTARFEAERAIDLVFRKLGCKPPRARTDLTPVSGGDFSDWLGLVAEVEAVTAGAYSGDVARSLAHHYGSHYRTVLDEPGERPKEVIGRSSTIRAQVYRAARAEMALKLEDVVMRRTDLATGEYPGRAALAECATILAAELGWSSAEIDRQVADVTASFPSWEVRRVDGSRLPGR
jgi:glycerol-3-phosphate dehydrogenase